MIPYYLIICNGPKDTVQPLQWWKRDRSLGGLRCHAKERAHLEPHVSFRVIVTLQADCEILFMASPSGWRPNMKTRQSLLTVWASNQSAKYGFPYVLIQRSSQRRTDELERKCKWEICFPRLWFSKSEMGLAACCIPVWSKLFFFVKHYLTINVWYIPHS